MDEKFYVTVIALSLIGFFGFLVFLYLYDRGEEQYIVETPRYKVVSYGSQSY